MKGKYYFELLTFFCLFIGHLFRIIVIALASTLIVASNGDGHHFTGQMKPFYKHEDGCELHIE